MYLLIQRFASLFVVVAVNVAVFHFRLLPALYLATQSIKQELVWSEKGREEKRARESERERE